MPDDPFWGTGGRLRMASIQGDGKSDSKIRMITRAPIGVLDRIWNFSKIILHTSRTTYEDVRILKSYRNLTMNFLDKAHPAVR